MTGTEITVSPIVVADLLVEGERMPVCVHVIDHPDARILVDTGFTDIHPATVDLDPRLYPLEDQGFDLSSVAIVVNSHLHFDHSGGNHLFPDVPIYVQQRELVAARTEDDYIREAINPPGVTYVPVDGEIGILPGIRLLPAPGHTLGSQIVVIDGSTGPTLIIGDTAVWFGELDEPQTEGQLLVHSLHPERVWLSHVLEPWVPQRPR